MPGYIVIKTLKTKGQKNIESRKKEMTHYLQEKINPKKDPGFLF